MPLPQQLPTTVLLVEDHFMTRWAAAEFLRLSGFKVIEATSLSEALGIAASGAVIDVVFSDIQLPDVGEGIELAHWFAKHRKGTPVLLTSGAEIAAGTALEALKDKDVRFLRKPYNLEQIVTLLRSMVSISGNPPG